MKLFAVLDELIDVVQYVVIERRGQQAAVAERAVAELGSALIPSDNFPAFQLTRSFIEQFVFAVQILVDDFAVVEHRLDLVRTRFWTKRERTERSARRAARGLFAREKRRAHGGSRIARHGLHVNVAETAALLERADQ